MATHTRMLTMSSLLFAYHRVSALAAVIGDGGRRHHIPWGNIPKAPPGKVPRESPLGGPPKGGKRPGGSPEGVPPGGIRQRTRCDRYGCHPKLLAERRITTISWFGCGDRTARGDSPANPHSRVSYRYHRKWLAGRRVSGPEGSLCWTGRAGWTVDGADGVDGAGGAR